MRIPTTHEHLCFTGLNHCSWYGNYEKGFNISGHLQNIEHGVVRLVVWVVGLVVWLVGSVGLAVCPSSSSFVLSCRFLCLLFVVPFVVSRLWLGASPARTCLFKPDSMEVADWVGRRRPGRPRDSRTNCVHHWAVKVAGSVDWLHVLLPLPVEWKLAVAQCTEIRAF